MLPGVPPPPGCDASRPRLRHALLTRRALLTLYDIPSHARVSLSRRPENRLKTAREANARALASADRLKTAREAYAR